VQTQCKSRLRSVCTIGAFARNRKMQTRSNSHNGDSVEQKSSDQRKDRPPRYERPKPRYDIFVKGWVHWTVADLDLNSYERDLLFHLIRRSMERGCAWDSKSSIAEYMGKSRYRIRAALSALEKKSLVEIRQWKPPWNKPQDYYIVRPPTEWPMTVWKPDSEGQKHWSSIAKAVAPKVPTQRPQKCHRDGPKSANNKQRPPTEGKSPKESYSSKGDAAASSSFFAYAQRNGANAPSENQGKNGRPEEATAPVGASAPARARKAQSGRRVEDPTPVAPPPSPRKRRPGNRPENRGELFDYCNALIKEDESGLFQKVRNTCEEGTMQAIVEDLWESKSCGPKWLDQDYREVKNWQNMVRASFRAKCREAIKEQEEADLEDFE
jgi:hypothetical protein